MVSVTDPQDRPRNELARQNFKIYENGRLQDIADFDTKYQPYSIGIILDLSGSMTLKLNWARQAVSRFIKTANPQNEYFVVGFNISPAPSTVFKRGWPRFKRGTERRCLTPSTSA